MILYKRRRRQRGLRKRFDKAVETVLKCLVIMVSAAPFSWAASAAWYFGLYQHDIHLDPHLEIIATASWIPIFGIMYGFLTSVVIATVFNEYKGMRMAIKAYDFETFLSLSDEDLSPLVHGFMTVLGCMVLGGFMLLAYPEPLGGFLVVGSTSYILAFIFFVVREIDEPLAGVWFIKTVPKEWEEIDIKVWRNSNHHERRLIFVEALKKAQEKEAT